MLVRGVVALVLMLPGGTPDIQDCRPSGSLMRLADVPEASGMVVSRSQPSRVWVHNDSGQAVLHAFGVDGRAAGRVTIEGVRVEDWEALAAGRCGSGVCLYAGDIGDNDARRASIAVYQIPEPSRPSGNVRPVAVFTATYPDGAHDAETLLVDAGGRLYVVTKGETGPAALYRFPEQLTAGKPMRLERVGNPIAARLAQPARITDGAVSADGKTVVLRSRTGLTFYSASDFLRGNFREERRVDLAKLGEPQGEAVAFGESDAVFVAGEGGGKKQPGTLAVLSCGR
jgi:hypothetical protein